MKIKEFREILKDKKADFAVFCNSDSSSYNANLFYFSGYKGLGALVIPQKKHPFLIVPEMEFQKARKSGIRKVYSMEKRRFFESIYKVIKENKIRIRNIAIDKNNFTLNSFKFFKKQFSNFF